MTGNNTKKVEEKIIDLKAKIDKLNLDFGKDKLTNELRNLRHRIFNAHAEAEIALESYIFENIFYSTKSTVGVEDIKVFIHKMFILMSPFGFSRKLSVAKKLSDNDNKLVILFSTFKKLNKIRNDFAHPKRGIYEKYVKRGEYKKALDVIVDALGGIKMLSQKKSTEY